MSPARTVESNLPSRLRRLNKPDAPGAVASLRGCTDARGRGKQRPRYATAQGGHLFDALALDESLR